MSYLKEYLKILLSLFITSLLVSTLAYFNIIDNSKNAIIFIVFIISILINSFLLGKRTNKNGYVEGIKIGSTIIFTFIIIRLLLKRNIIEKLLYYVIILITSIFGCILGINKKEKRKNT